MLVPALPATLAWKAPRAMVRRARQLGAAKPGQVRVLSHCTVTHQKKKTYKPQALEKSAGGPEPARGGKDTAAAAGTSLQVRAAARPGASWAPARPSGLSSARFAPDAALLESEHVQWSARGWVLIWAQRGDRPPRPSGLELRAGDQGELLRGEGETPTASGRRGRPKGWAWRRLACRAGPGREGSQGA